MRSPAFVVKCVLLTVMLWALAGCIKPIVHTPQAAASTNRADPTTVALAPEIFVELKDEELVVPAELPAGLRSVTVENTGQEWHAAIFRRLNEGVTMEELTAAFRENPFGSLRLTTQLGGPDVAPDQSVRGIFRFEPGAHIMVDNWTTPPRFVPFTVVESDEPEAQLPAAAVTVEMKEHEFDMPDAIKAGAQWWRFTNSGERVHLAGIVKLHEGKTIEELATWFEEGQGPPPAEEVAFWNVLSPGAESWGELTLPAGTYWLTDGLPDPTADGALNMTLGMAKEFSVTE